MQHLQRQKDADLIHRNLPLYIVASSECRTDGAVFGKDLQQSRYFQYMSCLIMKKLETHVRKARSTELISSFGKKNIEAIWLF